MDPARPPTKSAPPREVIAAIVSERARFQRFLAARTGSADEAEELLQQGLPKALQQGSKLRRGENAVRWFYRMVRNAVWEDFRQKSSEPRWTGRLWTEMEAMGENFAEPPEEWRRAVCACFNSLLPGLRPRYAEVIRRIDLEREPKAAVGREFKMKTTTVDVVLHRARNSLRRLLVIFCAANSREKCVEACHGKESRE